MSLKTYYEIQKQLNLPNVEVQTYNYVRILCDNSASAQEIVDQFNRRKEQIKNTVGVDIITNIIGRHNSIVYIEGLGILYDRSQELFNDIQTIIRRYSSEQVDGNVKQVLKVTNRRKTQPTSQAQPTKITTSASAVSKPTSEEQQTQSVSENVTSNSGSTGDIDGIIYADNIEKAFTEHIIEESVETCQLMILRVIEQFDLTEVEAKEYLDNWAKKNVGEKKITYDPGFAEGEGLIKTV